MTDRVPTKPGRVKLTKEDGTVEYAVLERADEPTQEGTPINKATLLSDATAQRLNMDLKTATVDKAWWATANKIEQAKLSTFQKLLTGRFP